MDFKDKKDFKVLFRKLYGPLCNFAFRYVNDESKAEDIVQEVFVHLWEKRNSIVVSGNIAAYLFTACKNKSLEVIRKKQKEIEHIDNADWIKRNENADMSAVSEELIKLELLYNSIRQLPTKCQKVFVLHKLNGLTYDEIAEHLNLSKKTIENHMVKALRILREAVINYKSSEE